MNARKEAIRQRAYRDLLGLAGWVRGDALGAIPVLSGFIGADAQMGLEAYALVEKLERAVLMLEKVISQTERRVFHGEKGLAVLEMVKSSWVYKQLKNFRAGIEANISRLKRSFGFSRCDWTGWLGFQQYVWSALVSYNLLVLARLKMV